MLNILHFELYLFSFAIATPVLLATNGVLQTRKRKYIFNHILYTLGMFFQTMAKLVCIENN